MRPEPAASTWSWSPGLSPARRSAVTGMVAWCFALSRVRPLRRRRITAEKVAIAAVMAGCRPEYMPVVLAVVRAMCVPDFGLHGTTASTGGSAQFIVVNGPVRRAIGMNSTNNALANASRANATIGRVPRLLIINVLGGAPGRLDRSTLGHPGRFTY